MTLYFTLLQTSALDALIAITAIAAVFGLSGFIVLRIIGLIRYWLVSRRNPETHSGWVQKLENMEQQQQLMLKRIQNLETVMIESRHDPSRLSSPESPADDDKQQEEFRQLKNKLRSS